MRGRSSGASTDDAGYATGLAGRRRHVYGKTRTEVALPAAHASIRKPALMVRPLARG